MRAEFEKYRDVKDPREAQKLIEMGEKYWFENQHYQPKQCMILDIYINY